MKHMMMASAAMALFAFSGFAHAQAEDISHDEVNAYLQELQEQLSEVARTGDFERLPDLTQRHVAENARVFLTGQALRDGDRMAFSVLTMDKEDLLGFRAMLGLLPEGALEEYALEIDVVELISHGPGAATVHSRWADSATIRPPATTGEVQPPEASFERTLDCHHVLQREDERLMFGLTHCEAEVNM